MGILLVVIVVLITLFIVPMPVWNHVARMVTDLMTKYRM